MVLPFFQFIHNVSNVWIPKYTLRYATVKQFLSCAKAKMAKHDIASMRVDYKLGTRLDIENLQSTDPMRLFARWFEEAKNCNKIEEANAMTIATCTR